MITLAEKMTAVDNNIRELWDALDEDDQKVLKSDMFVLNRYISNVKGQPTAIQQHYLILVNEYFNKHYYALTNHPKLQWLLLCMCNYDGNTKFFHEWISLGKKYNNAQLNDKATILSKLYPEYNSTELDILCNQIDNQALVERAVAHDIDVTTFAKKYKIKLDKKPAKVKVVKPKPEKVVKPKPEKPVKEKAKAKATVKIKKTSTKDEVVG